MKMSKIVKKSEIGIYNITRATPLGPTQHHKPHQIIPKPPHRHSINLHRCHTTLPQNNTQAYVFALYDHFSPYLYLTISFSFSFVVGTFTFAREAIVCLQDDVKIGEETVSIIIQVSVNILSILYLEYSYPLLILVLLFLFSIICQLYYQ